VNLGLSLSYKASSLFLLACSANEILYRRCPSLTPFISRDESSFFGFDRDLRAAGFLSMSSSSSSSFGGNGKSVSDSESSLSPPPPSPDGAEAAFGKTGGGFNDVDGTAASPTFTFVLPLGEFLLVKEVALVMVVLVENEARFSCLQEKFVVKKEGLLLVNRLRFSCLWEKRALVKLVSGWWVVASLVI
jgi:hypothetical protein